MNSGGRGQEGGSLCWFCLIANLSFDISPISQLELVRHAKPAPISARRMCALADMNSRRGGRPPHKTDIGKPAPTRPEELPNKNHLVGLRQARRTSRVGAECHGFNRRSFGKNAMRHVRFCIAVIGTCARDCALQSETVSEAQATRRRPGAFALYEIPIRFRTTPSRILMQSVTAIRAWTRKNRALLTRVKGERRHKTSVGHYRIPDLRAYPFGALP